MKKVILVLLALGMALFLAACGGDDSEGSGSDEGSEAASGNAINLNATNFSFGQDEFTVPAGEEITISLSNEEGMHGAAIDEFDVEIEDGEEAAFTPEEPGEYTIYCSIPCGNGHDDMTSTLVVE
ncbi:cytochrome c oxidase subunit 2 [Lentibacillus persicus]|uniref:Cytochrome c oxidase subunit 2 n=1 Tax=Lentibacillus persicus TaxID=640948 RepID=A0A1I1SFC2_9BACI|nr:cytochrome C oxidase subunit II [Lentibacillus persicus]SFD45032.1 cytochrome c oxidase subunit 2 [Lentibacillus persicus]